MSSRHARASVSWCPNLGRHKWGRSNCKKRASKISILQFSVTCGSPLIDDWLLVGTAKRSRLTAVQDGRSARATQACAPRTKKTFRASIRTHNVSGLRAPKAFKNGALPSSTTSVTVHVVFLDPADAAHVQVTEKAISRAPLGLQPRALGLSVQDARARVMCGHRLTKICWQRFAGHCEALSMLRQCR